MLELFNGPSSAFKDFGARFMESILSYFIQSTGKNATILTATSGNTGGAVSSAFHYTPGVHVFILYPKDKISAFQEKQIAGRGKNIHAFQINGNFDNCQHLAKSCFANQDFANSINLTSSNSVNFCRLIPQIIFYFEAYRQGLLRGKEKISCIIPSGNMGNLTAAVYAKKLGILLFEIIAATNENKVFTDYLKNGLWMTKESIKTISNAMDVGNPSNIERIF